MTGEINLPKMDGVEIRPGVVLIGEPTPIAETNKLRCLANVLGALCIVELSLTFKEPQNESNRRRDTIPQILHNR